MPIRILILPYANSDNPFRQMMIELLSHNGYQVATAEKQKFFSTITAVHQHNPEVVYFDWIQGLILGKSLFITLLRSLSFWMELQYILFYKKVPITHTLHNVQNHAGIWLPVERLLYTYFLRKCSRIRVYSETTRDKVASLFGIDKQKIWVVPDVPYHHFYPNHTNRTEARNYFQLPANGFVYLFFGMLKPYKGVEDLIQAFQQIATSNDYLIIAGHGGHTAYAAMLEKRAADDKRIILHNQYIDTGEVQYYFAAADVAVLPFKGIEHSGSVDLAMSFAKPVITRRTQLMEELLTHQQHLLFNTDEQLKEKLTEAKQADRYSIGLNNFQRASSVDYKKMLSFFDL